MTGTNWRRVADVVAERLANHTFCETHPVGKADPDCPFCRDRAAYGRYLTAGGTDTRDAPDPDARRVPIRELRDEG